MNKHTILEEEEEDVVVRRKEQAKSWNGISQEQDGLTETQTNQGEIYLDA